MTDQRFNPLSADKRWQEPVGPKPAFLKPTITARPNRAAYVLEMFPYPSGRIHIGPCPQLHHG